MGVFSNFHDVMAKSYCIMQSLSFWEMHFDVHFPIALWRCAPIILLLSLSFFLSPPQQLVPTSWSWIACHLTKRRLKVALGILNKWGRGEREGEEEARVNCTATSHACLKDPDLSRCIPPSSKIHVFQMQSQILKWRHSCSTYQLWRQCKCFLSGWGEGESQWWQLALKKRNIAEQGDGLTWAMFYPLPCLFDLFSLNVVAISLSLSELHINSVLS